MCYLCPTVCSTSSVCVSKSLHSRNECWRNRMLSADMCHSVIGATHPAGCCRHTGAQTNFTLTNTNIQQTHTPKYTHTHTQTLRSARITVRAVRTSWLSNPWTCANNFLSPGKGEGRRSKIKKNYRRWWGRYHLFIYMEHLYWGETSERKKACIPFCIVEMIDLLPQ